MDVHPDDEQESALSLLEGNGLFHEKRFEEALRTYSSSMAFNPNDPRPRYGMGNSHMMLGNYEDAITCYETGIKFSSKDDGGILNNLGVAYHKQGNTEKAVELYQEAIRLKDKQAPNNLRIAEEQGSVDGLLLILFW